MSHDTRAFAPLYVPSTNTTQGALQACATAVAGVASSASTLFPGTNQNMSQAIQVSNKTSVWVHVNFGVFGNIPAATLTNYAIAPGATVIVTVNPEVTGATVISDGAPAASTAILFARGDGL